MFCNPLCAPVRLLACTPTGNLKRDFTKECSLRCYLTGLFNKSATNKGEDTNE